MKCQYKQRGVMMALGMLRLWAPRLYSTPSFLITSKISYNTLACLGTLETPLIILYCHSILKIF